MKRDSLPDEVNHCGRHPQYIQWKINAHHASHKPGVNQIDTDLSELSAHVFDIHAVPPSDSMLSDCQTSLRGECHQHILRHTLVVYMPVICSISHYLPWLIFLHRVKMFTLCSVHWLLDSSLFKLWWPLHTVLPSLILCVCVERSRRRWWVALCWTIAQRGTLESPAGFYPLHWRTCPSIKPRYYFAQFIHSPLPPSPCYIFLFLCFSVHSIPQSTVSCC